MKSYVTGARFCQSTFSQESKKNILNAICKYLNLTFIKLIFDFCFFPGLHTVAAKLIALGVDINAKDIEGRTALHHASYHGKADIVKLLIDAGCNIHTVSEPFSVYVLFII